jgi:hypothetical protein
MRLSLYRTDPPHQAEMVPAEDSAPRPSTPLQAVQLSESERQSLHSWASKHGFVLRSPADEWLAEAAWRSDLESHS